MPIGYEPAPDHVEALMRRLVEANHPDLREAEPEISILNAFEVVPKGDDDAVAKGGPQLRRFGFDAPARTRVTSLEQRVGGMADVVIQLDVAMWAKLTEPQREAVLDQQLYSLEPVRDGDGAIKLDDQGRPQFTIRRPTFLAYGYEVIARRHGEAAHEMRLLRAASSNFKQLAFDFGDGPVGKRKGKPAPEAKPEKDVDAVRPAVKVEAKQTPKPRKRKATAEEPAAAVMH